MGLNHSPVNPLLTGSTEDRAMTPAELERVREWALQKLATGEEPPWAWYQYMKLREALEAILAGMDAVTPQKANSPQEVPHRETLLRLVAATDSPDTALPHRAGEPVRLPM
jgi:hypothetical protein